MLQIEVGTGPIGPSRPQRQLQRDLDERYILDLVYKPCNSTEACISLLLHTLLLCHIAAQVSTHDDLSDGI